MNRFISDLNLEAGARPSPRALKRLRAAVRQAVGTARRYQRRRRQSRGRRRKLQRNAISDPQLAQHWEWIITTLLRFGGASSGNAVKLFCDGDETLDAIWAAIDNAQHRIFFETYILEPDRVGQRTIEVLTRAAERGCEVRLLYDAFGSPRAGEMLRPLREAGARVDVFNPIWRLRRTVPLFRRDHRKIIVIDDQIGFCGGMNVSEDYAGPRYGKCTFRDCHMMMQGPCVRDLAAVFTSSLRISRRTRPRLGRPPGRMGETFVQVLASHGVQGRRSIQRAVRFTIRHAARSCLITTPYFIPPQRVMRALNHAAKRGVDVRILTAGKSDVPIVRAASQHIYGELLKHGVRIFEVFDSTLHAKTIAIDGLYSTVGSFNLDTWSYKRNLEVNVAMVDAAVAAEVRNQFEASLPQAVEVTLETWNNRSLWRRLLNWAAYQLLRL